MAKDLVIYTVIFGRYDVLRLPRPTKLACDLVCFTDDANLRSDVWDIRYVGAEGNAAKLNRQYKMLPHRFLSEYNASIYIDGNVSVVRDPTPLAEQVLAVSSIGIPIHPETNCAYEELVRCIDHGFLSAQEGERWLELYAASKFPRNIGLYENNVIVRSHHSSKVAALMDAWWKMYSDYGGRDQLCLTLLAWKYGVTIHPILCGPRHSRRFFAIGVHRSEREHGYRRWFASYVRTNKHLNPAFRFLATLLG